VLQRGKKIENYTSLCQLRWSNHCCNFLNSNYIGEDTMLLVEVPVAQRFFLICVAAANNEFLSHISHLIFKSLF
jgi:hypothetical protein